MTASIETTSPSIPVARRRATGDRFLGFRALARKDLAAWRHGIRPWVILIVSTGFMTLAAANAALNVFIAAQLPPAFSTIWISDHLQFGDDPQHEAWTLLTYLAATFPRWCRRPRWESCSCSIGAPASRCSPSKSARCRRPTSRARSRRRRSRSPRRRRRSP